MPDRLPVLFGTDIGRDIDDAQALAYLLQEPRCELLGITTVTEKAGDRAPLAEAICRAAGRPEVPVRAGSSEPTPGPQRQPEAPQKGALPRWSHRREIAPATAVPFMQEV